MIDTTLIDRLKILASAFSFFPNSQRSAKHFLGAKCPGIFAFPPFSLSAASKHKLKIVEKKSVLFGVGQRIAVLSR